MATRSLAWAISRINASLDESRAEFAARRLEEPYPYLILDARYERVREGGIIRSQAILIAIGVNTDGYRCVLGIEAAARESTTSWRDFLAGLRERGLAGVGLCVSDDHPGLRKGIAEIPRGRIAALLRALPAQRARPPAAQGGR